GSTVGGTLSAAVSGTGVTYTVSVTGMSGNGTVVATVTTAAATDAAGNPSLGSTSTDNAVTFDTVSPAVTVSQAAGQGDPSNASPLRFSVVFGEPVTGFDASDVGFTGSTPPGTLSAAVSGPGASYTVSVTGMTGPGTVVLTVADGAAADAAGNPSRPATYTDNT